MLICLFSLLMKRSKQNTKRDIFIGFQETVFLFMTRSAMKGTIKTENAFKVSLQVVVRQSMGYPNLKSRIEAASEGPRVNFDKNKWGDDTQVWINHKPLSKSEVRMYLD